ncbi:MAG TPA: hypothetical protein VF915_18865 [Reyranella sp.]
MPSAVVRSPFLVSRIACIAIRRTPLVGGKVARGARVSVDVNQAELKQGEFFADWLS